MTMGTEGDDNLTNDTSLRHETIDALGGDDVITVTRPMMTMASGETVTVDGGSGFDTDEGTDTLNGVETIQFSDGAVSLGGPVLLYGGGGMLVGTHSTIRAAIDAGFFL